MYAVLITRSKIVGGSGNPWHWGEFASVTTTGRHTLRNLWKMQPWLVTSTGFQL